MRIGFAAPVSGAWSTPENAVHVARAAEQSGYDSLWTYQRVLGVPDNSRGEANRSVHDPLVTLSFLAARTTRIRLGVAVLVMPLHAPAVLAKQLTTLDVLSGGRLDVGLGNGSMSEEYTAAGVSPTGLGQRADDFLACLHALWSGQAPVEHDGAFYRVPPAVFAPGPIQKPHPPLLLGGSSAAALRRAGRLCDGWIASSRATPDAVRAAISVVRDSAEEAGRDADALRFVCRAPVRIRSRTGAERPLFTGTTDQVRSDMAALADTGLTEIFVDPNFDPEFGSPDAPAVEVIDRVDHMLRELAPGTW